MSGYALGFHLEKIEGRSRTRSAYLNVGFRCINNCLFCAVADVRAFEMEKKTAISAIDFCYRDGCKEITISGGEPTLRHDFKEIIEHAIHHGLKIHLQTNARPLSEKRFCNEIVGLGIHDFYVSLHGSRSEIHDNLTRRRGSFRETMKGIENLVELGSVVDTNFVITKGNYMDIPDYAKLVTSQLQPIETIYFTYPTPVGNAFCNAHSVLVAFSELKEVLKKAINIILVAGKRFSLVDVPLCVYDWRNRVNYTPKPKVPYDTYIEPSGAKWSSSEETGKLIYDIICEKCNAKHQCPGIYQTYMRLFGSKGLCEIVN